MTQHTPTPWAINDHVKMAERSIAICGDKGVIASVYSEANAAFIVKAVNFHDELVNALERLANGCGNEPGDYAEWNIALRKARTLLAKVRS